MIRFSVPDMSCQHCQATIEKALSGVPEAGPIEVDLDRHVLTTAGAASPAAIIAALAEVDYAAAVLAG